MNQASPQRSSVPEGSQDLGSGTEHVVPVIGRNPQKFVENIFKAKESDYQPATQRILDRTDWRRTWQFRLCNLISRRGSAKSRALV